MSTLSGNASLICSRMSSGVGTLGCQSLSGAVLIQCIRRITPFTVLAVSSVCALKHMQWKINTQYTITASTLPQKHGRVGCKLIGCLAQHFARIVDCAFKSMSHVSQCSLCMPDITAPQYNSILSLLRDRLTVNDKAVNWAIWVFDSQFSERTDLSLDLS